jgi:hypothetical protein
LSLGSFCPLSLFEEGAAVAEGRILKPRSDMARNLAAASRAGATFVAIRY